MLLTEMSAYSNAVQQYGKDAAETANQMGYNDERNPQHSQDIMTNGGSIGNYQANVRNNYLRGVSKF